MAAARPETRASRRPRKSRASPEKADGGGGGGGAPAHFSSDF